MQSKFFFFVRNKFRTDFYRITKQKADSYHKKTKKYLERISKK